MRKVREKESRKIELLEPKWSKWEAKDWDTRGRRWLWIKPVNQNGDVETDYDLCKGFRFLKGADKWDET